MSETEAPRDRFQCSVIYCGICRADVPCVDLGSRHSGDSAMVCWECLRAAQRDLGDFIRQQNLVKSRVGGQRMEDPCPEE